MIEYSKPRWRYAPRWANYMAMDQSGEWWWFERRPTRLHSHWSVENNGEAGSRTERYKYSSTYWANTLDERPEAPEEISTESLPDDVADALHRMREIYKEVGEPENDPDTIIEYILMMYRLFDEKGESVISRRKQ